MTDFVSLLTIASHSDIDWILGIESQSWYSIYCIFRSFQVGQNDQNCDNGSAAETERSLGSSDDSIIRPGEETNGANTGSCGAGVDGTDRAQDTTHKSFIDKRKRHTSVPQTARTQVCGRIFCTVLLVDVHLFVSFGRFGWKLFVLLHFC